MRIPRLTDHSDNVYSQFGEDGILAAILGRIGEGDRVCIEFGAWDGFHLSNTANLWTRGWKGILIEADEGRFAELCHTADGYDCLCIHRHVGIEHGTQLEEILDEHEVPLRADLLSIDIDGDDYYVFASLKELRPRVVCCEYNPTFPPDLDLRPEPGARFGCSPLSLVRLAESKGYRLVAMTEGNCIFVGEEDYGVFSDYETELQHLATANHLSYLINGYDGSWILSRRPTYGMRMASRHPFVGPHYRPAVGSVAPKWNLQRMVDAIRRYWKQQKPKTSGLGADPAVAAAWRRDRGDETLRLQYPLDANSLVLDVGGYRGQWASDLFAMYGCTIHVFEPVPDFAKAIRTRFSRNPAIHIHDFGLAAHTGSARLVQDADRSSAHAGKGREIEVAVNRASDFLEDQGIDRVDLMKVNIEGDEYDLLSDLIDTECISIIHNLQVQFHSFVPEAERRRTAIQRRLSETHELTYEYPFVWENWRLKGNPHS